MAKIHEHGLVFCDTNMCFTSDSVYPMSTAFTNRMPGYYDPAASTCKNITCQYCGSPWRIEMENGEGILSLRCQACGGPLFDED